MKPPSIVPVLLACLALATTGCDDVDSNTFAIKKAQAQARFDGLRQAAAQHASQEGLDASFASREILPKKVIMHDCLVVFTLDGTTVGASTCEIKDGVFAFHGTPVMKTGGALQIGDQQTTITATPAGGGLHYEITTTGRLARPKR